MTTDTPTGEIETATAGSFDAFLRSNEPLVVEFMSYGCAHCRTIEPVVVEVAKALGNTERIVRVNVGVDQDLGNAYGVQGTPTFVMFRNGQEIGRAEGPSPSFSSLMSAVSTPFAS